ncbi:phytanoyl-CoA dioxygenase family protein [Paraburkholderia sp. 32]|uniref:phytanoyl-CoA dioxygenase family protein n=1 Tax=Paraburkholderia sp. 32 TaxID=2991057 RepID=UPI003D1BF8BE
MASAPLNIDDSGCSLEISVDETPASSRRVRAGDKQNEAALFCSEFLSVDIDQIVSDLNVNGYYAFPSAISQYTLKTIERDATQTRLGLNENSISGVYSEKQYYLTNLLAVSKTFYNFATSSLVLKICERYLGNEFRLKALRYYETYGGHHMQWHTDNKTDKAFAHIPGIIFIFYVSEVEDGEFQYIEGSHLWSGEKAYSDYTDEFIEANYESAIRSFKMPSGSLLIYNTYGIHRARPVNNKNFVRKSVFLQVDSEIQRSEPIIVNTEFITRLNDQISMFLGFGQRSDYEVFPKTTLNSLPLDQKIIRVMTRYVLYRLSRGAFSRLPQSVRLALRRLIKR